MTKDFSQHSKIIERFRGQVNQKDFEAKFIAATQHIPKTERFLLKMELKRLASPCTRLIDLRGHVDGECKQFEDEEQRVHYLDDVAIRVYQQNIVAYGSYTFGVYEAVNNTDNNFRVIYQREKANIALPMQADSAPKILEKQQYPAKFYRYGNYHNRSEERMNFAIALQVGLDAKTKLEAISSDLSVSGCKFRFNQAQNIKVGQEVSLEFTGLMNEFSFGEQSELTYEIVNIKQEDKSQFVGVRRVLTREQDAFKQFLQGYIQGNKRRYKINLENTIAALQARSFEQFALPKVNELPIFMEQNNGQLLPRYALTSNNNQATFQYWQDEKRDSTLHCLVNEQRIERLLKAARLGRNLLVYSFIHQSNSKLFFYTADEKQLAADKEFMRQFIGFSASKASFAVTELSIHDVDIEKAHTPFTVVHSLPTKDEYLNMPLSSEVKLIIAKLPYIVVAKDITCKRLRSDYSQLDAENIEVNRLRQFGHKRLSKPLVVDGLGINYRNQRQEPRFKYTTPVQIEVDGVTWQGTSEDFSISGLKIHLEKSAVLAKGEVVKLAFPQLQKITKAFDLKSLPYEIVRTNQKKDSINLKVFVEKHQHLGRAFFKALIEKNKDKLTPDEYAMMIPGLAKALRSIYAHTTKELSLFIQTSGSRYKVEAVGASQEHGSLLAQMKSLSDRPNHLNLYPLLSNQQAISQMSSTLKKMQADDQPITDILHIAINDSAELVEQAVTTKLDSELKNSKHKQKFISNARKKGSFYSVMVKLSRTDEPDMDHLNSELSYIGSYAIHRGKQIEQDIWSVAGIIQCFDISQEVILRHQLLPENEPQTETKPKLAKAENKTPESAES